MEHLPIIALLVCLGCAVLIMGGCGGGGGGSSEPATPPAKTYTNQLTISSPELPTPAIFAIYKPFMLHTMMPWGSAMTNVTGPATCTQYQDLPTGNTLILITPNADGDIFVAVIQKVAG